LKPQNYVLKNQNATKPARNVRSNVVWSQKRNHPTIADEAMGNVVLNRNSSIQPMQ